MSDENSPAIDLLAARTVKQPVVFRCPNPECNDSPLTKSYFEFESDEPICPKCGVGPPYVQPRVLIHLMVKDKKGRIEGQYGQRYAIACDRRRDYIATPDNSEAASGDPIAVNCPGCLASPEGIAKLAAGQGIRSQHFRRS
jgi:rubredoxin